MGDHSSITAALSGLDSPTPSQIGSHIFNEELYSIYWPWLIIFRQIRLGETEDRAVVNGRLSEWSTIAIQYALWGRSKWSEYMWNECELGRKKATYIYIHIYISGPFLVCHQPVTHSQNPLVEGLPKHRASGDCAGYCWGTCWGRCMVYHEPWQAFLV